MDPDHPDSYRVLAASRRFEVKIKRSRFIAEAFRVSSLEACTDALDTVRKREHAATHHCSAFRLGAAGDVFRCDDDGEPRGTAGPPILKQIEGRGLVNTLVVVTRYYGGTKLGTGGLTRAYGGAASAVLDRCPVRTCIRRTQWPVAFAYTDTAPVMHTVASFGAEVVSSAYGTRSKLVVSVRASDSDAFMRALLDATGGRVDIGPGDEEA